MGKRIETYLINESPTGPRTYVLDNSKCQAIVVPRIELDDMLNRPEFGNYALYLLIGEDCQSPKAYIGQSRYPKERIEKHLTNKQMDFFNTVIVFTAQSKTGLDDADIKYLEAKAYQVASEVKSFLLANTQAPKFPTLSEAKKDSDETFFADIKLLSSLIGFNIFDYAIKRSNSAENIDNTQVIFYTQSNGNTAKAVYGESGMTVLAGSEICPKSVKSYKKAAERDQLVNELTDEIDGRRILRLNRTFSSPNEAIAFCLGRNENARTHWKDKDDKEFGEYFPK